MNRKTRRASAQLQALESRRMLSVGLDVNSGTVRVSGGTARVNSPVVNGGGSLSGSGLVTSSSVSVATGAILDLANNNWWSGQLTSGSDALVMYTYNGDANLSGSIDADDYFLIDRNFSNFNGFGGVTAVNPGPTEGTANDDFISIVKIDGLLTVVKNGAQYTLQSRDLHIDGKGGNDKIVIDLTEEDADVRITINGGDGNDTIWGGAGAERIYGGDGDDLINGNGGKDTIYGEDGNDSIRGGGSADLLDGGGGYDTLRGDAGSDILCGGANPDRLRGSDGNDRLEGGGGRDILAGEAGDDEIFGNRGTDFFCGGDGADRFADVSIDDGDQSDYDELTDSM